VSFRISSHIDEQGKSPSETISVSARKWRWELKNGILARVVDNSEVILSPDKSCELPDIFNNVGPVKLFLNTLLSFHLKEFFSFVLFLFCIDDHGSFVILRSASVRPKHLFDQNFDHDYSFKLPLQGAGCPIKCTAFYFAPCPVTSCPAYEPNSNDREYSHPFRHIQYNRIASLRPIATLAMLLCRRIAKWMYRRLQSGWLRAAAWAASTNKKRNKELLCPAC
jgi:hypothetical protein